MDTVFKYTGKFSDLKGEGFEYNNVEGRKYYLYKPCENFLEFLPIYVKGSWIYLDKDHRGMMSPFLKQFKSLEEVPEDLYFNKVSKTFHDGWDRMDIHLQFNDNVRDTCMYAIENKMQPEIKVVKVWEKEVLLKMLDLNLKGVISEEEI